MREAMPERIRVGYRDYTVEEWPARAAEAKNRYAECDKMNAVIRVRTDIETVKTANSLLHEILHACYDIGGIEEEHGEEQTVLVLANQLTQIWRDNPKLITWLNEQLT